MTPRICVVGAGPAGLSLARVLHRHGHPVTVLERDASRDARPPGGALDLHEGLGQRALDKAGLLPEFRALARLEGQAMRILDTDGTVLRDWRPGPDERANPEIDRGQLRDLLLGPLDVQWGRAVTEVVPDGGRDGVLVRTEDGRQEAFDLVVGADGAWSRVRPAVSPATPRYTGVTFVETSLDDIDDRHPDLARLVGDGAVAVYGVNRAIVAQRNSGGHVKVYAQFRTPLPERPDDHLDAEAVRADLLPLFDGWAAPVLDLLRRGTVFARRPLHVLPVAHTWAHVPGVTLLGDAAHLMPPLGAGANLALLEGAELAESLTSTSTLAEVDEAVRAFENSMWSRAERWATMTMAGLERLVSADPSEALAVFDAVQSS
ncbi:NAD(P)/FAD-dependent oxidoreductase [Streptomyces sp. CRN 30]|uniref:FAD-dependent oxidoreductase n=1 Tax=Streptomyces sp. CRN 30 TaxID=3075613 RepID=UPI002A80D811|nr:NAD(P)/FAD-dependent oxidoreductase [Streptomyces sp. CRN 30]